MRHQEYDFDIPEEVIDYIEEHDLYYIPQLKEWYRDRYNHVLGTAKVAYKIAKSNRKNAGKAYIAGFLHDLGKMGQFGKPNYVVNMVKDGRPTKAEPEQKYKQSEAEPFKTNPDLMYIGHEVRSVAIASKYIDLTEEEQSAILYHNGLYGSFKYEIQGKEFPLYMLLHFSDMWVSRVTEVENEKEDE